MKKVTMLKFAIEELKKNRRQYNGVGANLYKLGIKTHFTEHDYKEYRKYTDTIEYLEELIGNLDAQI